MGLLKKLHKKSIAHKIVMKTDPAAKKLMGGKRTGGPGQAVAAGVRQDGAHRGGGVYKNNPNFSEAPPTRRPSMRTGGPGPVSSSTPRATGGNTPATRMSNLSTGGNTPPTRVAPQVPARRGRNSRSV